MSSRANFEVGSGSGRNTNPSKRKKPSKKGKNSQTWGAPNPDFKTRLGKIRGRKCIVERGIDMEGLKGTFVREAVEALGWKKYVQRPNRGTLELVKEFYASMVPDLFYNEGMPVMVRDKLVVISAPLINSWLGTADVQGTVDGIPNHEYFKEEYDGRLAANLHQNGSFAWNKSSRMMEYEAGVAAYEAPLTVLPHGALIGKNAYNAIARLRGFPPLPRNVQEDDDEGLDIDELENLGPIEEEGNEEDEDEDEDYMEQDLEDDPDAEAGEATLEGIMTMLRGMNKKIDGLVSSNAAIQGALEGAGINITHGRRGGRDP
ncbi:hypothetical protein Q3G72_020148 [Acer saccharum]|nr:hypothetical protein Q3G72_020148 [Acer saccharum]